MKKIIISSVVAASLSTSVMAEESSSKYYIGVGVNSAFSGTNTQDRAVDYTLASGKTDTTESYDTDLASGKGTSVKFGIKNESSRFEIGYTSIKFDDKVAINSSNSFAAEFSGLDFDFIKPFTDNSLKPYVTLGLGLYSWDGFEVTSTDGSTSDRRGVTFNYGAGVLYSMGSFELDIAYKGKLIKWSDVTGSYSNASVDYEDSTTLGGLYAGVNIHF